MTDLSDADVRRIADRIAENDPAARAAAAQRALNDAIRGDAARRRTEREQSITSRLFDRRLRQLAAAHDQKEPRPS